jgi:hypothetical protein
VDWGYAQKRNTSSKQYEITGNKFLQEETVFDIMGTDSLLLTGNKIDSCVNLFKLGKRISALDTGDKHTTGYAFEQEGSSTALNFVTDRTVPVNRFPAGRNNIRITPWGPYNFEYPCLFLDSVHERNYHFTVLHPGGKWRILTSRGFNIISSSADGLVAVADSTVQQRLIELEYMGAAFTNEFGKKITGNAPFYFGYKEFDPLCTWNVYFYSWDKANEPNNNYQTFAKSLIKPIDSVITKQIDYTWWGAIGRALPKDSFATVAETMMELPAANYETSVTADDMVKLFVDGKPVIDAWDKKYTLLDENTHHSVRLYLKGRHHFKLIHAENEGLADLVFYIKPYK